MQIRNTEEYAGVRLACHAMATRFELILHGDDPVRLRAAGEEAFREITRYAERLSFYDPISEISKVNRHAALYPVQVSSPVYRLLKEAKRLWQHTLGAFDPTVGPLMDCWGYLQKGASPPTQDRIEHVLTHVGMQYVILNDGQQSVYFEHDSMAIDLGGIGKGFAIDEAMFVLESLDIQHALLHGGTSTVATRGIDHSGQPWKVGLTLPPDFLSEEPAPHFTLSNQALSVSSISGKGIQVNNVMYGHILDPRTGWPVSQSHTAAVMDTTATATDAWATAMLVLSEDERKTVCAQDHFDHSVVWDTPASSPLV